MLAELERAGEILQGGRTERAGGTSRTLGLAIERALVRSARYQSMHEWR